MDELNNKCKDASKDYIQKYDKLISMVNGYEKLGERNELGELQDLTGKMKSIINDTLISEDEFSELRKEQNNIMNEYNKLEDIKTGDPFSKEALEFTEQKKNKDIYKLIKDKYELNHNKFLPSKEPKEAKEHKELKGSKEPKEPKEHVINVSDDSETKNIDLSKYNSHQRVMCDGSVNQYYKMPNICININSEKEKKEKKPKRKTYKKKKINLVKPPVKRIKKTVRKKYNKKSKCNIDKVLNHKIF